jgi:hypothetical protein
VVAVTSVAVAVVMFNNPPVIQMIVITNRFSKVFSAHISFHNNDLWGAIDTTRFNPLSS